MGTYGLLLSSRTPFLLDVKTSGGFLCFFDPDEPSSSEMDVANTFIISSPWLGVHGQFGGLDFPVRGIPVQLGPFMTLVSSFDLADR